MRARPGHHVPCDAPRPVCRPQRAEEDAKTAPQGRGRETRMRSGRVHGFRRAVREPSTGDTFARWPGGFLPSFTFVAPARRRSWRAPGWSARLGGAARGCAVWAPPVLKPRPLRSLAVAVEEFEGERAG